MEHLIAFNGFRGGNKGSVSSLPLSEYDKTIRYPWMHEMVLQIRGEKSIRSVDKADAQALAKAQQRIKGQLPFRCAHYYQFRDNRRSQKNAVPESFLFQTTIDVDDKEYVDKAIERARELNCSDSIWRGALLHLEYSARNKLHIDIRMPIGMTIEETQRAYCEALGVPYDESCISPERMLFITDKDSEIYRSPHWYEVLSEEEISRRRKAFLDRGLSIDGRGVPQMPVSFPQISQMTQISAQNRGESLATRGVPQISQMNADFASQAKMEQGKDWNTSSHEMTVSENEKSVKSVKSVGQKNIPSVGQENIPSVGQENNPSVGQENNPSVGLKPSEKNLAAFDLFRNAAGLKDVDINTQGSRHSSLLAIMSAGASRVMSEDELRAVVAQKMPSYASERDCQQLIHDFYAKYGDSSKPMSQSIIRINAQAEKSSQQDALASQSVKSVKSVRNNESDSDDSYPDPPEMPKKLPGLVELLVSKTPDVYKPAVAHAIFPSLATHLWHTTFRYIDNVEHEATLMCCLLAGTGAGKNCVQKPIDYIMADIRQRDLDNLKREKEWKEEMMRKGANKDKRKRPADLVIQEIDADMTNPAFVMRTAEAQDHFLYTSLNEVNQFDALRGQGGQQFVIMCLAFDPGNRYGQTRVGTQSVTERVTIRFNWNASTTIKKGQRYFRNVLTDGPLSRINFCTIPEREIGADMPVYGSYDEEFGQALQPYIENLRKASGLIDCPEAFQLATKLKDENAEFARLSQNRIYENLSFRGNVIAYLKACVLYVANGCKWEPEIDEFIRWSERYDLYCKMRFFGDAIARAEDEGVKSSKRGPSNLLQLLPDEFTLQQAQEVRLQNGLEAQGTRHMINVWVHRNYIKRKDEQQGAANGLSLNNSNLSFIKLKFKNKL